jgi:hypothetical protein
VDTNRVSDPFDPSWPFDPTFTRTLETWLQERGLELSIARAAGVSFLGFYDGPKRVHGLLATRGDEQAAVQTILEKGLH